MTSSGGYRSPIDFRRALTDRLRAMATPHGPWSLAELQRQFAYDRLLVRAYEIDNDWVLKGAAALIARGITKRHTVDIDLYRATDSRQAERDLRAAATLDLGDWFVFSLGPGRTVADGVDGLRLPATAAIGAQTFAKFHVDLVTKGVRMTAAPDAVDPLANVAVPGLRRPGYLAYPLADHVADKVAAMFDRYGADAHPSTRYKDLVDLVSISLACHLDAAATIQAIGSESGRRVATVPSRFEVPDTDLWPRGYASEARRASNVPGRLDDAVELIRPFLDPLLSGRAVGSWDPLVRRWGAA